MSKRLFLRAAGAASAGVLLQACGGGGGGGGDNGSCGSGGSTVAQGTATLLALLDGDSRFAAMRQAVGRAGASTLATLSDSAATLTLFAVDNAAFDAMAIRLGFGNRTQLLDGLTSAQWADILSFNLLPQARSGADLRSFAACETRPPTLYSFRGNVQALIPVNENGQFNIWDGVGRTSISLVSADIGARNGVLHQLSDLLLPRGVLTLLQMLRANIDYFSEFGASAAASNAASLLNGTAFYTVFVPVNGAGAGALSSTQVRRHVVANELDSDDFTDGQPLTPLAGSGLTLRKSSTALRLDSGATAVARITDVDFWARNGVIHVIDAVIP